jgi:hypothetical protein
MIARIGGRMNPGSALPFQLPTDDPKGQAVSSPEQVVRRSISMLGEEIGQ